MKTINIIQKNIEEIRKLITRGLVQRDVDNDILVGVGVYYRDEAERILQSLLDEQKKEIVICSALLLKDGYVIRGHRHNHCFGVLADLKRSKTDVFKQGFMTSDNRFVVREEAYKIYFKKDKISKNKLYSEDIY